MRQPTSVLRYLVILLALSFAARAYADDRAEARTHYQAGVKFYGSGDYRSAIREFSAAQQLVPADLNNYNLALCYDKLGDAEPATQYYRAFLDKQPNTDKRAEIEASISRLEAASRSAASKKAEEARRLDEARKADEARKVEEARKADDARKAAEAAKAEEAKRTAGPMLGPAAPPAPPAPPVPTGPTLGPPGPPSAAIGPAPGPAAGPVVGPAPAPPDEAPAAPVRKQHKGPAISGSISGSVGTPGTAAPVPTGDSQLDRVNSINIDQIRDARMGSAGIGMSDTRGGPSVAANGGAAQPGQQAQAGQPGQPAPTAANGQPMPGDEPKKETPLYKKWWFWGIVAVAGYVGYQLVANSNSSPTMGRQVPQVGHAAPQPGGLTLLRW